MRTEQRNMAPRLMNVAFCSSSVGCGHTRASVAIHDALRARGQLSEATFIEALEHAPRWFSTVYRDGYLRAIRHAPRVVGAIYNSTDIPRRDRRPLGPALDRFEDRVMANFRAHPGLHAADVVVSTHFLTSALLGRMRMRGELRAPVVTVVTDEHPHAVWLHRGVDLTCVASRAARTAAIAGGMDPSRVEITGIPIDPRFCMTHQRSFAVTEQPRPMILVCGGGHGLGDIPAVVRSLLATSLHCTIVVVCGKNAALEVAMRGLQSSGNAEGASGPELRVLGYSNAMHELMAAADLMVGKPGGLTTTEARAVGLPMVLLQPIPGQEERNADMLVSLGAAVRAQRATDAGPAVAAIIGDPVRLRSMRIAASAAGNPRAAFDVATGISALLAQGNQYERSDRLLGRPAA